MGLRDVEKVEYPIGEVETISRNDLMGFINGNEDVLVGSCEKRFSKACDGLCYPCRYANFTNNALASNLEQIGYDRSEDFQSQINDLRRTDLENGVYRVRIEHTGLMYNAQRIPTFGEFKTHWQLI